MALHALPCAYLMIASVLRLLRQRAPVHTHTHSHTSPSKFRKKIHVVLASKLFPYSITVSIFHIITITCLSYPQKSFSFQVSQIKNTKITQPINHSINQPIKRTKTQNGNIDFQL